MATLSQQALQSFSVSVGVGPTTELDTKLAAIDALPDLTDYTADIFVNTCNATVNLQGGFITNETNVSDASISWESNNVIVFAGLGAPCTITGQAGANALIIAKTGTRLGFLGTAPVVKQTVTGSKSANAALASLLTALANYGIITDSSS